jgi:hypothetical protein
VAGFSATDSASADRFGASSGNLLSGNGGTGVSDIQQDYYAAIEQFMAFQDGKGQPLLSPETIAAGVVIIYPASSTQIFEQAFMQLRQGITLTSSGVRGTAGGYVQESNIVQDSSRNVDLWGSPRLDATNGIDWYVFLKNPPKKATFVLDREGVQEFSSLEGDNNGDHTRDTGEEYIQWERRAGAGWALPHAAIKINNS